MQMTYGVWVTLNKHCPLEIFKPFKGKKVVIRYKLKSHYEKYSKDRSIRMALVEMREQV